MNIKKLSPIIFLAGLLIFACKRKEQKEFELGKPNAADFSIRALGDSNTWEIKCTTPGAFITNWVIDGKSADLNNIRYTSPTDTLFFVRKGTYTVALTVATKDGSSNVSKTITVPSGFAPATANFTVRDISNLGGLGPNMFEVIATTPNIVDSNVVWYHYNGEITKGQLIDTVYLPFAGDNPVTARIKTSYGVDELTKMVSVQNTDMSNPFLNDVNLVNITGGLNFNGGKGKTWVACPDPRKSKKANAALLGSLATSGYDNFPNGLTEPAYVNGLLNNSYTFIMDKYQYKPSTQNTTTSWPFSDAYFGTQLWLPNRANTDAAVSGVYNVAAVVDPHLVSGGFIWKTNQQDYTVDKNKKRTTNSTLEFSNGTYLGFFTGVSKYVVVKSSADTLVLASYYADIPYVDKTTILTDPNTFRDNMRFQTFVYKP